MPDYRRADLRGGSYFFTVNTYRRQPVLMEDDVRMALREAIVEVRQQLPFTIGAWVLLPDHLHCLWTLPDDDRDFAKRWGMIKRHVSRRCDPRRTRFGWSSPSRRKRHEGTLWQRRYWEHLIRDEADLARHLDYIHWNPVKHGWVQRVADWPYSTFHRFAAAGVYPTDWGTDAVAGDEGDFGE